MASFSQFDYLERGRRRRDRKRPSHFSRPWQIIVAMSRLPDRFDLWVRKARECPDPARQVDYVLGALAALPEWCFLNTGTPEKPRAARTKMGEDPCVLVFSDAGRVTELIEDAGKASASFSHLVIPTAEAMAWCVEGRTGLLINPGEEAVLVPLAELEPFYVEWKTRAAHQPSGFWIPNLTSAEEDFWQEHGL
jgi:hypothetical protein